MILTIVVAVAVGLVLATPDRARAPGPGPQHHVYNRPQGNCLEMWQLLRNRPYPPKHGVHSYAKPVPICKRWTR